MEKRSGFKECPRCGLRNKPSVSQCDFCGWQFEETQDEWIDQIRALEKIGTEDDAVAVDEELSKRIEATIIKPDEVAVEDFAGRESRPPILTSEPTHESRPISTPPTPEERREIMEAPTHEVYEPPPEQEPAVIRESEPPMTKAEAESAEVAEFVESMIEEVGVEEIGEPEIPVPAPTVEEAPLAAVEASVVTPKEEKVPTERKVVIPEPTSLEMGLRPMAVPAAILGAGAAAYVGILVFSILQSVSWTIGWAVSIFGAILMTVGCSRLYDAWKRPSMTAVGPGKESVEPKMVQGDRGIEVFICPLCNEVVTETDDHCPNCGAEFEREGN